MNQVAGYGCRLLRSISSSGFISTLSSRTIIATRSLKIHSTSYTIYTMSAEGSFPEALKSSVLNQQQQTNQDTACLVWDFTTDTSNNNTTNKTNQSPRQEHPREEQQQGCHRNNHVKIYLKSQPLLLEEQTTTPAAGLESSGPDPPIRPNASTVIISGNDAQANDDEDVLEESVLQYQRQWRKTQAAKRAGTTLTNDQFQQAIVYEDQDIICVNKPAGVLTVPGINHQDHSLANVVFRHAMMGDKGGTTATTTGQRGPPARTSLPTEQSSQEPLEQQPIDGGDETTVMCPDACSMTVHRLDMDTSGLVVFGKTKAAVLALQQVFRRESEQSSNVNNSNKKKRGRKSSKRKQQYLQYLQQQHKQKEPGVDPVNLAAEAATQTIIEKVTPIPADKKEPATTAPGNDMITKEYEALVCGHLPLHIQSGYIDLPLQRDIHHPPFMRVSTPHSEALARQVVDALRERNWTKLSKRNPKPSQTKFRVVSREYFDVNHGEAASKTSADVETYQEGRQRSGCFPVTRLSLIPVTGRTHQLRVHCAAAGFPILGDPAYGLYGESAFCAGLYRNRVQVITTATNKNEDVGSQKDPEASSSSSVWRVPISLQKEIMTMYPPGERYMCLHAKRLGIPHPTTGERMIWEVAPKF